MVPLFVMVPALLILLNTCIASVIVPAFVMMPVLLKVAPFSVTVPPTALVKFPRLNVTGALNFPMLIVAESKPKLPELVIEAFALLVKFPKSTNVPRLLRIPELVKLKEPT